MKYYLKKSVIFFLLLGLGIIYAYFIRVELSGLKKISAEENEYPFTVVSKINQTIHLHIASESNLQSLSCEGVRSSFKYFKGNNTFKASEDVKLSLKKGKSHCVALFIPLYKEKKVWIRQMISYVDYCWFFLFWGLPLFHVVFLFFIKILEFFRRKNV